MKRFHLEPAGTAEVLRAAQRDELMIQRLQQQSSDLLLKIGGNRLWMQHRNKVQLLAKMLYSALTTLSDCQTLGEEYTGMIQVDRTYKRLPSKQMRLLSLLLDCFGQTVLMNALASIEKKLRAESSLTSQARASFLEAIGGIKSTITFLTRFHRACFYWNGRFYRISNRIAGIDYVLVRRWLKDRTTLQGFKVLSVVTMIQLLIYSAVTTTKWLQALPVSLLRQENSLLITEDSENKTLSESVQDRCALCLEARKTPTATSCGHIFCWNCIACWLQTRAQCPLCRELVEASRLIPVRNITRKSE